MLKSKPHLKTTIFIDWSNVFIPAKNIYGEKISPKKLRQLLIDLFKDNTIIQTHLFSSKDSKNKGQENFFISRKREGIIVHTEELIKRPTKVYCKKCDAYIANPICCNCGEQISLPPYKSKKIDIKLATVMLDISDTYEEAILVSGDQDFIPAIRMLREKRGKKIHTASFKKSLSHELVEETDRIVILDKYISKIKQ